MRLHGCIAAAGVFALAVPTLRAQDVTFHGQVRPRYEYRDPLVDGPDAFTSMRVRAALDARLDPGLTVLIELQDVRIWGEEHSTLGDFTANHLDMHQAYVRYQGPALDWLTATIGRQETNFGGERLVGAVGWSQQGRSFDGVRLDLRRGRRTVALIAYTLAETSAATHEADAGLFGAYATFGEVGPGALDLYLLHDRVEGAAKTDQPTFGARYAFRRGRVEGRAEASLQRGERAGKKVSAFAFGGRLSTSFAEGRGTLNLWYDHLSGDDDASDGETSVFSTLYATNHKFYGLADVFLDIPAHTGGAGLVDTALKLGWKASGRTALGADVHIFRAAKRAGLSTSHFGDEIDLTVSHAYSDHLGVAAGFSLVFQDDALADVHRLSGDLRWLYVMFDARF
jgi:hypothetical protein